MATPRNARPGMLLDPGAPINNGLVGWWPMWEGAGGKTLDMSGKNNHGTLTNGPVWSDGGLKFDGTDDYVDCGLLGAFSTGLTKAGVSFRIKSTSTAINHIFGTINTTTSQAFYSLRTNFNPSTGANEVGKLSYFIRSNTSNNLIIGVNYNTGLHDGREHSVVCTHDKSAGTGAIYIDGVPQTITYVDASTGTSWLAWNNNFTIGKINGVAGNFFNGTISDFRLYNRTLSALEAKQLYVNPNIGLWVPDITRYYIPAAGGGFQPAWAANSNVLLGGGMTL